MRKNHMIKREGKEKDNCIGGISTKKNSERKILRKSERESENESERERERELEQYEREDFCRDVHYNIMRVN